MTRRGTGDHPATYVSWLPPMGPNEFEIDDRVRSTSDPCRLGTSIGIKWNGNVRVVWDDDPKHVVTVRRGEVEHVPYVEPPQPDIIDALGLTGHPAVVRIVIP